MPDRIKELRCNFGRAPSQSEMAELLDAVEERDRLRAERADRLLITDSQRRSVLASLKAAVSEMSLAQRAAFRVEEALAILQPARAQKHG